MKLNLNKISGEGFFVALMITLYLKLNLNCMYNC